MTSHEKNPQRIDALNGLRGLAAVLVAMAHFILLATPTTPGDWRTELAISLGAVGVGVFFLLSGFVTPIAFATTSSKAFLLRRVFRLYPVFIVCCFARLLAGGGQPAVAGFDLATTQTFLLNVSLFGNLWINFGHMIEPVVWTLAIEVKFYLLCALLVWMARRNWTSLYKLALGTLAVFALLAFRYPGLTVAWTGDFAFAVSAIPFMFAGFFISLRYNGQISTSDMAIGLVSSIATFLMAPMRYLVSPSSLACYTGAAAMFLAVLIFRKHMGFFSGRLMTFIGTVSYPMYAIHSTIAVSISRWAPNMKTEVRFVVFWLALLVSAYVIHRLIEQPMIDLSKRLTPTKREMTIGEMTAGVPA